MKSEPPTGDDLTRLLVSMKKNVLEQVAKEPSPAKRSASVNRAVGLGLGLTLFLGVGAGAAFALGVLPGPSNDTPAVTADSTQTPTATPTPGPTEYAVNPGQPASRLELDCETLVDDDVVAGLFNVAVAPADPIVTASGIGIAIPRHTSVLSVGGTLCEWSNGEPENDQYGTNTDYTGVMVSVVPRPAEGWSERAAEHWMPAEASHCTDGWCSASTEVAEAWVAVDAHGQTGTVNAPGWQRFVDSIIEAVSAAGPAKVPPSPQPLIIDTPEQCDAVVPREVVATLTASDEVAPARIGGGGWSIWAEALHLAGDTGCSWLLPDSDIHVARVQWVQHGSWAYERMIRAGTSSPLDLNGLRAGDAAVLRCSEEFGPDCAVDVRIDSDWINVSAGDETTAIAMAEEVLARLLR